MNPSVQYQYAKVLLGEEGEERGDSTYGQVP